jgi:hypothetical protein
MQSSCLSACILPVTTCAGDEEEGYLYAPRIMACCWGPGDKTPTVSSTVCRSSQSRLNQFTLASQPAYTRQLGVINPDLTRSLAPFRLLPT